MSDIVFLIVYLFLMIFRALSSRIPCNGGGRREEIDLTIIAADAWSAYGRSIQGSVSPKTITDLFCILLETAQWNVPAGVFWLISSNTSSRECQMAVGCFPRNLRRPAHNGWNTCSRCSLTIASISFRVYKIQSSAGYFSSIGTIQRSRCNSTTLCAASVTIS